MCLPWAIFPSLMEDKAGCISPELAVIFRDLPDMWLLPSMCLLQGRIKILTLRSTLLSSIALHIHLVWIIAHLKLESTYLLLHIRE